MKRILLLVILTCAVPLAGCYSPTDIVSPTSFAIASEVEEKDITPLPSSTLTEAAVPTLTQTEDITPPPSRTLPLHTILRKCVEVQDQLPSDFLSSGVIFFEERMYHPDAVYYLLDAQSEKLQTLPNFPKGGSYGVSPDGKWLAHGDNAHDRLLVIGPSGEIRASQPYNDRWRLPQSWLDSERLVMVRTEKTPIGVDILNVFTGEIQIFDPELSDIYIFSIESPGPTSWYIWKLVYSPDLTRLVYLRQTEEGGMNMVMVDQETNKTIWVYPSPYGAYGNMPVWSPDGERLLFVSYGIETPFKLYTVDRNGKAIQWIDLDQPINLQVEWIWSPDNRYVAFLGDSLYILDTETYQLVDYCIEYITGLDDHIGGQFPSLFWSPDSKQIIFQRWDAPALVVDLASGIAAPLVDTTEIRPIGWMSSK